MFNTKKLHALQDRVHTLALKNAALEDLNRALRRKADIANFSVTLLQRHVELHRQTIEALDKELQSTKDCLDKVNYELDRVSRQRDDLAAYNKALHDELNKIRHERQEKH